ncbi:hypothetical protein APK17_RS21050, partial [Escherichia coli]
SGGLKGTRGIWGQKARKVIREVLQARKVLKANEEKPDHRDRWEHEVSVGRLAPEVNLVLQVREANEERPDLRDLVESQVRQAALQMWLMQRRHRRELCS